jgi:peptidoglycan/LPS O-acetylase OafA/YrhL
MTGAKKRLQEFEALRALAILLLLVLHSDFFALSAFGYELGFAAVPTASFLLGSFFFLAGYFWDVSLQKSEGSPIAFVKSKFVRIFPPYWLALALFMLVLEYNLKRFDFAVYATNLQAVFSPAYVKQIITLWYISLLVVFYLIFGVLLFVVKSDRALLVWSVVVFTAAYAAHLLTGLFESRFFMYYFIFLAGIYFSRFETVREGLFETGFVYKAAFAALGLWLFSATHNAGYPITHGLYILAADIFILGWVLLWLTIFRTRAGGWWIWTPISTASYFAYLCHRPVWHILSSNFDVRPWGGVIQFYLVPGSIVVLVLSYFLQRGYDLLLSVLRVR